jgi:acetyltransferase-like isoleucine patch superfamily enzyme
MLTSKMVLAGFPVSGFWVDVGDPRSYLKANMWALDSLESTTAKTELDAAGSSDSAVSEAVTIRRPIHLGKNVRMDKGAVLGPYACVGDGSEISAHAKIAFSVVYENTRIGMNTVLDTCVIAENCRIGDRVQIDRGAVVGAGTELGDESHLTAESRVGPFVVVQPHTVVEGTVTAFEKDIERVCGLLEKSHAGFGLTSEEARVCGALSELGEADSKTVARFANIPHPKTLSVLIGLEERGIVSSFENIPKMYALIRDEVRDARKSA